MFSARRWVLLSENVSPTIRIRYDDAIRPNTNRLFGPLFGTEANTNQIFGTSLNVISSTSMRYTYNSLIWASNWWVHCTVQLTLVRCYMTDSWCVLLWLQLICIGVAICLAVRAKDTKNRVNPLDEDIKANSYDLHRYWQNSIYNVAVLCFCLFLDVWHRSLCLYIVVHKNVHILRIQ